MKRTARPIRLATAAAAVLLAVVAPAVGAIGAFRIGILNTKAPVALVAVVPAGMSPIPYSSIGMIVDRVCLSFRNDDARTAHHVRFRFIYYDKTRTRVGEDFFDRKGTFSTGVLIEGYSLATSRPHVEDCVPIHFPREGIDLDLAFVEAVDFTDGTAWKAASFPILDHLGAPRGNAGAEPTQAGSTPAH